MDPALKQQMLKTIALEKKTNGYLFCKLKRSRGQQKLFYGMLLPLVPVISEVYKNVSGSGKARPLYRLPEVYLLLAKRGDIEKLRSEHIILCEFSRTLFTFLRGAEVDTVFESVPSEDEKREDAAREMRRNIGKMHSKLEGAEDELAKGRQMQNFFEALKKSCGGEDYSPSIVAYLFFAEKFYKQILNFFHIK